MSVVGLVSLLKSLLHAVVDPERSDFLSVVYSDECVVVSVFKLLPELDKSFVLKLLLLDRPIKEQLLAFWTVPPLPGLRPLYEPALKNMVELGILVQLNLGSESSYDLNPQFRTSLIGSLKQWSAKAGSTESGLWTSAMDHISESNAKPAASGSETKWHHLLDRIISSSTSDTGDRDIDKVILRLGFGTVPTPPNAYRFVLSDVSTQLWVLIAEFVSIVERQRDLGGLPAVADVIRVIAGVVESKDRLIKLLHRSTPVVLRTVTFLQDLDCIRPVGGGVYSLGPTAVALNARTDAATEDLLLGAQLIVDSNMHVTAYTRSGLQIKLISLFCQVHRVLGNVLVGVLTRVSVQKAIDGGGVSSDSIIRFLSGNLHSSCGTSIPPNVANQIRLWEADCPRNRLKVEPCIVFSWRGDRTEQASRAIAQVRQLAESGRGLLFVKTDPDGRIFLGVKSEVAKACILNSR